MATKPKLVSESEFKIEKGIPIPRSAHHRKYPFANMSVGDSVFIPRGKWSDLAAAVTGICSAVRSYRDMKFTTRRDVENDGVRVWRVE